MAKRPLSTNPSVTPAAASGAPKPRARKAKAAASIPPSIDTAPDNPSSIASETPAPDRILAGTPDFSIIEATVESGRPGPSLEEIRERAYHRYLARGGSHGGELEDWLEAERELRGE